MALPNPLVIFASVQIRVVDNEYSFDSSFYVRISRSFDDEPSKDLSHEVRSLVLSKESRNHVG